MKEKIRSVVVIVSDDGLSYIESLADQLRKMGFDINRVLPVTGIITGVCAKSMFQDIANLDGVEGVEEEQIATLPPNSSQGSLR